MSENLNAKNLEAVWDEHCKYEFELHDVEKTMATMIDEPVNIHVPTLMGGASQNQVRDFYNRYFVHNLPADTEAQLVSRTVGKDRVVDEFIFKFTHTIDVPWMLPGVPPTGKRIEVPLVVVVAFQGDKIASEHIYWDQASVLVQAGLIDGAKLPIAGIESAKKLADPKSIPSDHLLRRKA